MIAVNKRLRIIKLLNLKKKNLSQISREIGVNFRTVKKIWRELNGDTSRIKPRKVKIKAKQISLINELYETHKKLKVVHTVFNQISDVELSMSSIRNNRPALKKSADTSVKIQGRVVTGEDWAQIVYDSQYDAAHLINDAVNIKKQACDILAEARDEDKISHVDQNTGFFNKFDFINFLSGYIWAHIVLSYFFI
jgi:transposase-like protein